MAIADLLESKFAVNPFGKGIEVDRKPESAQDVKFEISEKVNFVFEEYKKACSDHHQTSDNIPKYISRLKLDVLSPSEIDLFLQFIIKSNLLSDSHIAGVMVSRLINDSYNAGNNNFSLTKNDCNISLINSDHNMDMLFSNVHGTEKNPVIATVLGNVGYGFGYKSEHCVLDVKGNASASFGLRSKHCNYTLHGDAGQMCGYGTEDCTYKIMGDAGFFLGVSSKNCIYTVCGTIDGCLSEEVKNSTFKVMDKDIYGQLINRLPRTNIIQFVDGNDKIIMETKK